MSGDLCFMMQAFATADAASEEPDTTNGDGVLAAQ